MTPSEIADWLEDHGKRHTPWCDRYAQAAATIRAQAEEVGALSDCQCELEAVSLALGSGVRFMDPPDGGSVTIAEQVVRMRIALHEAETKLKIATEALEEVYDWLSLACIASADDMAQGFGGKFSTIGQALARIDAKGSE